MDFDECTLATSCDRNAICSNTEGSYTCSCYDGFHGDGKLCQEGECDSEKHCPALKKCVSPTTNECECKQGLITNDDESCQDIDECSNQKACPKNSTCQNGIGSFTCHCNKGLKYIDGFCADIDECAQHTHSCLTVMKSECTNTNGSYLCSCTNTVGSHIRQTCAHTFCEKFS